MNTNALRVLPGDPAKASPLPCVTWTPADVASFLKTSEEIARRKIKQLETNGQQLRVPPAVAGRRCLVYAARFLRAAGLSDDEIRAVLQGGKVP